LPRARASASEPAGGDRNGRLVLALVGGGGSRVPVLYEGLRARADRLGPVTLRLYDIDAAALARTMKVLRGMDLTGGPAIAVASTTDLAEALDGADFVLTAIRAGGFESRRLDEAIPLSHGVLGQETVGPGGFALAARNVPALQQVAERMLTHCPDAWMVNLTNPAGLVTQALVPLLGARVIGVCDSPLSLARQVAAVLGVDTARLHLDYGGLNHLGWLSGVWLDGIDVLPDVLASDDVATIEEVGLFGVDAVRELGAVPNEYVWFYEQTPQAIANIAEGDSSRGAFLLDQHRALAAAIDAAPGPREALAAYLESLKARQDTYMAVEAHVDRPPATDVLASAGGYHEMALSVVDAVVTDRSDVLIVNTPNRGALPFLPDDDVVEVPAVVRAAGVFPLATRVPESKRTVVEEVKAFEREALRALDRASADAARSALAAHPVVPSAEAAARILRDYRRHIPDVGAALGGEPPC
jgi:6-phospho-beta-glucosidase